MQLLSFGTDEHRILNKEQGSKAEVLFMNIELEVSLLRLLPCSSVPCSMFNILKANTFKK